MLTIDRSAGRRSSSHGDVALPGEGGGAKHREGNVHQQCWLLLHISCFTGELGIPVWPCISGDGGGQEKAGAWQRSSHRNRVSCCCQGKMILLSLNVIFKLMHLVVMLKVNVSLSSLQALRTVLVWRSWGRWLTTMTATQMRVSTEFTISRNLVFSNPKFYVISILSCCLLPRERQLGWRQLAAQQKTEDCGSNRWGCRGVPLEAACLRVSLVLVFIGGSSLPSSLNISSDFLQYFGTNLCPCWDNGKWKCAIELQNATKYLQELTQDPVWGITSVKGHIGQSEPSIVAATCLLKTFRLSIKCRSPPLWSGQKLPFDINICCLPGCHGYSFRSQLIVFLTWIK